MKFIIRFSSYLERMWNVPRKYQLLWIFSILPGLCSIEALWFILSSGASFSALLARTTLLFAVMFAFVMSVGMFKLNIWPESEPLQTIVYGLIVGCAVTFVLHLAVALFVVALFIVVNVLAVLLLILEESGIWGLVLALLGVFGSKLRRPFGAVGELSTA